MAHEIEIQQLMVAAALRGRIQLPVPCNRQELIRLAETAVDAEGNRIVPLETFASQGIRWDDLFKLIAGNGGQWHERCVRIGLYSWCESQSIAYRDELLRAYHADPLVWLSPVVTFAWAVNLCNQFRERSGKPSVLIDEYRAIYDPPKYEPNSMPYPVVTALSRMPKHLERQTLCLDSWKRFGFEVWAQNTSAEIAELRDKYPQVDRWIECNEVSTDYSYPTQLIRNLAMVAVACDTPILLLNSDIELRGCQTALSRTPTELEGCQLHCIRWNYTDRYSTATEFQWGIDGVTFTPRQALALPDDMPLAIGQAMWDYAVPYFTLEAGFEIEFLHERLLFHQDHPQHWVQNAWVFGSDWLSSRTDLEVRDSKASAMWRQSLDPDCYWIDGQWLAKYDSLPPARRGYRIDYQKWASQPASERGCE